MPECAKMVMDLIEIVGIEDFMPRDNLLHKIDIVVDFTSLYEMVEPL